MIVQTRQIMVVRTIDTGEITVYISVDNSISSRYEIIKQYGVCNEAQYKHPSFNRTYKAAVKLAREIESYREQYLLCNVADMLNDTSILDLE